jgi:hypothetical protein
MIAVGQGCTAPSASGQKTRSSITPTVTTLSSHEVRIDDSKCLRERSVNPVSREYLLAKQLLGLNRGLLVFFHERLGFTIVVVVGEVVAPLFSVVGMMDVYSVEDYAENLCTHL